MEASAHDAEQEGGIRIALTRIAVDVRTLRPGGVALVPQDVSGVLLQIVDLARIDAGFDGVRAGNLGDVALELVRVRKVVALIAAQILVSGAR